MSYIANKTRVSSLTIGGIDYTSAFQEWVVSDSSAYKNGCIQTTGSLTLGNFPGGPLVEDYDRNNFKRGTQVLLDLVEPGGVSYRHPRGFLYVISSSYSIETEQLIVEIGCRLTLMALTEEIDELIAITPVTLDVSQTSFQNCSAAFASVGKYVYQNNVGALQTGVFFDGDTYEGVSPGQWISVLGKTAVSASPLQGSGAIPDQISLSYQVPAGGLSEDNKGLVETVETDSYYFTAYPATVFVRKNGDATASNPNGTLDNVNNTSSTAVTSANSSPCGNTPDAPTGAEKPASCNEGYELNSEPVYLPAFRRETNVSYYDGPGAQISRRYNEVRGPAIEANSQYYADKFAYCRNTWATKCNPNGSCPFAGMEEILLGYSNTINYYGNANELVRTIQDVYSPILSAAQPSDWRSGIVNGAPQDFDQNISTTLLFRSARVDTEFYKTGNANIQKTTTYSSMSNRGVGIGGKLDALNGIKTVTIRRSYTNTTVDITPDIVNSPTTDTEEEKTIITLFTSRYTAQPEEVGPYILEEQIPVPLLFETRTEIDAAVTAYENYITRFTKGDIFGIQLAEAMRTEVATSWFPGMPFRYSDPKKDKVLALRMDATSWGVSRTESAFVTNGVWIGFSDGTVNSPSNILGNSQPDMGGGTTPPTPITPPSIDDETNIDSGSFAWNVDVFFGTSVEMIANGGDGVFPPPPSDETVQTSQTFTVFVEGLTVGPGDLLATSTGGSIPLDLAGSLVVEDATVVDPDLFSS
jgi:hypothetical protein